MTRNGIPAALLLVGLGVGLLFLGTRASTATLANPRVGRASSPSAKMAERAPASPRSGDVAVQSPGEEGRAEVGSFSLERLRGLWMSEPEVALAEAEVLENEVTSVEERGEVRWIRTRSLVNLGRFSEARAVALAMKRDAPDSPFTVDVERHLLVHPFGAPPRNERRAE